MRRARREVFTAPACLPKQHDQVLNAAAAVYRLYGVSQNLKVEHPDCEHEFPPEVRDAAYRFLDQHLR